MRGTLALITLSFSLASPALANQNSVSISLSPGAGVLLAGMPEVRETSGSTVLTLEDIQVLDASGSGSGAEWTLQTQSSSGNMTDLADSTSSDDTGTVALPTLEPDGTLVVLTAGPTV